MTQIRLKELIAPSFYEVHRDIKRNGHTHYWLKGGRGSTKSSFAGIEIPKGIMTDAQHGEMTHAVVMRRYDNTVRESVYAQILWAINRMGVRKMWDCSVSPMQMVYRPTGQKIIFTGVDDVEKVKSIKVADGYIKYIWYEEITQFEGAEKVRAINQSLMRGGPVFVVLYTYNPPKSNTAWVNREVQIQRDDTLVHHSTYLDVPKEWLGEPFITEAEHLKQIKPDAYRHEYLGEVVGTGGEVFANLLIEEITDEQIATFDKIRRGIDWGYAADPFHYLACHYDKTRRRIFIYSEIHKVRLSNREAAQLVKKTGDSGIIICDSAEPKSIAEFKDYGLRIKGARKGPDSVEYGIKFLQDLEEIVIDPIRCPNTTREFQSYELDIDKEGNFKAGFPDRNNHSIDACRYALEDDMRIRTAHFVNVDI